MKNVIYLIATALFALVACEQPEPNALKPEGAADEVETQLVLSVSTGTPATRMSADAVQKNNNFLGITDARMYAFHSDMLGGADNPTYAVKTDGTGLLKTYELGTLYLPTQITASDNKTSSSNRILKLMVPNGVNSVVFYGKAPNPTPGAGQGYTLCHYNDTLDKIHFHVKRRIGDATDLASYDATARVMIAVVNFLMDSRVEAVAKDEFGYAQPEISVKEIGHIYGYRYKHDAAYGHDPYLSKMRDLNDMEQLMGEAYYNFSRIPDRVYRAGNSSSIIKLGNAIVQLLKPYGIEDSGDALSANMLRLGTEIERRISLVFEQNQMTGEITAYKQVGTILSNLGLANNPAYAGAKSLNDYPYGDFNIPEGAAQFTYTHVPVSGTYFSAGTDEFYYLHPNAPLVNPNMESFEPRKYVFPAELMYYVNSGLRTSDNEVADANYPNGVTPWDTDALWTEKGFAKNGTVGPDTKAIAVRDNINYGVSLLQTSVQWGSKNGEWNGQASSLMLSDNRGAVLGIQEGDRTFPASSANLYLRGVLVGGVNPLYDWQYLPTQKFDYKDESDNPYGSFDGVIYDDQLAGAEPIPNLASIKGVPVPTTAPNYTLVYDNYNPAKDKSHQDSVYVTLEFVNMGEPFYGKYETIPTGGTFYLLGKLEPNFSSTGEGSGQFSGTWPSYYQIPPVYGIQGDTEAVPSGKRPGQSKQIPRVFMQNYVTKVTFRINEDSLKYAFYAIPDLKAAQMSLGLSVDLSWIDGYSFDVTFGQVN